MSDKEAEPKLSTVNPQLAKPLMYELARPRLEQLVNQTQSESPTRRLMCEINAIHFHDFMLEWLVTQHYVKIGD